MFRIQDNVPEVYINESRDFQLLARLSDLLFSGIKYDVDSMVNILDSMLVKDRMLQLMCTKVGFFPTIDIDSQVLKYIISSFPYILKNKGNEIGIIYAVNAILKAENNPESTGYPIIRIINNEVENTFEELYTVYIYTEAAIYNKKALQQVLRYVLPAGYQYKLYSYKYASSNKYNSSVVNQSDTINMLKIGRKYNSQIRTSIHPDLDVIGGDELQKLVNTYVGAFDTVEIATSETTNTDTLYEHIIKDNTKITSAT